MEITERQARDPKTGAPLTHAEARPMAGEYYIARNIAYRRGISSEATTLQDVADAFNVPYGTAQYWGQHDRWRQLLDEAQPSGMVRKPSSTGVDKIETETSPNVVRKRMQRICMETMEMLEDVVAVGAKISKDLLEQTEDEDNWRALNTGQRLELLKIATKLVSQELPALYKALGVTPSPEDDRSSAYEQMTMEMGQVLLSEFKKQDSAIKTMAKKLVEMGALPEDRAADFKASIRVIEESSGGEDNARPQPGPG